MSLKELWEGAVEEGLNRVLIIDRWKGGPGRIKLYRIKDGEVVQVPPQICIRGIRLRRELTTGGGPLNSLVICRSLDESSEIGKLARSLSDFFDIRVMDMDETRSRYEAAMDIRSDEAEQIRLSFLLLPKMTEIGPRITISHLVWDLQ